MMKTVILIHIGWTAKYSPQTFHKSLGFLFHYEYPDFPHLGNTLVEVVGCKTIFIFIMGISTLAIQHLAASLNWLMPDRSILNSSLVELLVSSPLICMCNSFIITMTAYWAQWYLKSPASRLFTQQFIQAQIKENIKAPHHWPLCGEFTGDQWIPHTKGQQRGKCFHLMTSSWHLLWN